MIAKPKISGLYRGKIYKIYFISQISLKLMKTVQAYLHVFVGICYIYQFIITPLSRAKTFNIFKLVRGAVNLVKF